MKVGQELRIRGKKAATRSKDASDSENPHTRFERMNSGMSITSPSLVRPKGPDGLGHAGAETAVLWMHGTQCFLLANKNMTEELL